MSEQLHLPTELEQLILDDWELVNKEHMLVPLPRPLPVSKIIHAWLKTQQMHDPGAHARQLRTARGIVAYFNVALPQMLLYKFERLQYRRQCQKHGVAPMTLLTLQPEPADWYGAEHLVRMLTKIQHILKLQLENQGNQGPSESEELSTMYHDLNSIARFLVDNGRLLFAQNYQKPDLDYFQELQAGAIDNTKNSVAN